MTSWDIDGSDIEILLSRQPSRAAVRGVGFRPGVVTRTALALAFVVGVACGLVVYGLLEGAAPMAHGGEVTDPREVGVPWAWLAFGFGAQVIFMSRMLVQWLATERARSSVVPVGFWWLSLVGGLMLLAYFLRRGDPVGSVGQLFGVIVYLRNLFFLRRRPGADDSNPGAGHF